MLEVLAQGGRLDPRIKERIDVVARLAMAPTPETVSLDAVWAAMFTSYLTHLWTHGESLGSFTRAVEIASDTVATLLKAYPRGGQ